MNEMTFLDEYYVSDICKLLLSKLLEKNPNDRIDWEDYLNNEWFNKNLIEEEENKLLEISIKGIVPNIDNFNLNENKFVENTQIQSFQYIFYVHLTL